MDLDLDIRFRYQKALSLFSAPSEDEVYSKARVDKRHPMKCRLARSDTTPLRSGRVLASALIMNPAHMKNYEVRKTDLDYKEVVVKDRITREEALALLEEYDCAENHVYHMLAVEAAMRAYARRFGEDEDFWGAIGLVHDFEYDKFPEEHPKAGGRILREKGYSDRIADTILSHGETGVPRDTQMAKTLHAVDELTGLIVAVALVRPSKDIRDVKVKSVRKKWGKKRFAAAVDREEIERAAEDLGVELWDHVGVVLKAMQSVAGEISLDGRMAKK